MILNIKLFFLRFNYFQKPIKDNVVILVRGDIFIGDLDDIYAFKNSLIDINPRRLVHRKFICIFLVFFNFILAITLPSNQYFVNISNHKIVALESGKIRTKDFGNAFVSIIDNYIPTGKHSNIPRVKFHVVNPNIIGNY